MAQKLNPFSGRQFLDANGDPYSGAQLFIYSAGSSTKVVTTKDSDGLSSHANPIILNSRGEPGDDSGASQAIWQAEGTAIKLVLAPSTDTDPPVAAISTWDNLSGINDATVAIDQWIGGPKPTYVSATTFTLVGDQTSAFHVGRRLKTTNAAGTVYGTITATAYTSLTTVTVVNDSGSLDSGLSAVGYGLISADNTALPYVRKVDSTKTALQMSGVDAVTYDSDGIQTGHNLPIAGMLTGLGLSNDTDTDHDIAIAAGSARDSSNAYTMDLGSVMTKQIDATWAAGDNAGGDFVTSGTPTADTWYHVFLIRKDSDGTIDAGFDTSVSAANIPSGYTAYRRIGSVLTDGSSNIIPFIQSTENPDRFDWDSRVTDILGQASVAGASAETLSVPSGIEVEAVVNLLAVYSSSTTYHILSALDTTSQVPSVSNSDAASSSSSIRNNVERRVRTNTSSQIRLRSDSLGGDIYIVTLGWYDKRGA